MASNDNSVYCSTSGTFFSDKDTLTEHYKSDFHRYNLKRKVAGLPPVTKEWFEARKEQLLATAAGASKACIWVDPLTKKKFQSKQTYDTFVESRKYKELVRKSGNEAPAVKIIQKKPTGGVKSSCMPFCTRWAMLVPHWFVVDDCGHLIRTHHKIHSFMHGGIA